jgi:hypothetical protein
MKSLKPLCAFFILLVSFSSAYGQAQILSILPNANYQGQTQDVTIRGLGTHFRDRVTTVSMGQGIQVQSVDVINTETIIARVSVSPNATAGSRDVTIVTGNEKLIKEGGLLVNAAGGNLTAIVTVTPVQSMHVSDFDPNNLQNSPLLFSVTITNDMQTRNLHVLLTISGQNMGDLGTATKSLRNVSPMQVIHFDNRQFDKYKLQNTNSDIVQSAIKTGTLPADIYIYHVQVFDDNNNLMADAQGQNVITNVFSKPQLISPGNNFFSDPEVVHLTQPLFQWFSQGNSYDFALYEIKPGQVSAQEITMNRPVYQQTNITQTTLLYPASAQILREGQTYAWQIKANYNGSTGNQQLPSDVFWFKLGTSNNKKTQSAVVDMHVEPNEVSLGTGNSYKFRVKAFDAENDSVSITPNWKVVPANGGKIDQNGVFTAGDPNAAVAVVAGYGDLEDYATVTISGPPVDNSWAMQLFLRQLFGVSQ